VRSVDVSNIPTMKVHTISKFLLTLAIAVTALASTQLSAEVREWTSSDGTPAFKGELVNAYGDTAYFKKENGAYIHLPVRLLAKYDIACILQWARERDAAPSTTLEACQGIVAKDIVKQWPNRAVGENTSDKENIGAIVTPRLFTFIMIKRETGKLYDIFDGIADAEKKINGENGHIMETVVITSETEDEFKSIRYILAKHGGNWLIPNEWAYKDKKDIWTNYWRIKDVSVLIVDLNGTMLCDSTAKDPTGKEYDPIEFLNNFAKTAENIRKGKDSVPNPFINHEAFDAFLADALAKKITKPSPVPIPNAVDFSGLNPATFASLVGKDFIITVEIGIDGQARNLVLKKGGDASDERELKQASTLWVFEPAFKDGVPVVKKIGIPIRIKASTPSPSQPAQTGSTATPSK
jgi:hypothetical protein